MPRPVIHESHQRCLIFFIRPRSRRSLIASLPMKSISCTWTFGPSVMWNVRRTSFGPPGRASTVWSTSANMYPCAWKPCRMTALTRRMVSGSMNESIRSVTPCCSRFSRMSSVFSTSEPS